MWRWLMKQEKENYFYLWRVLIDYFSYDSKLVFVLDQYFGMQEKNLVSPQKFLSIWWNLVRIWLKRFRHDVHIRVPWVCYANVGHSVDVQHSHWFPGYKGQLRIVASGKWVTIRFNQIIKDSVNVSVNIIRSPIKLYIMNWGTVEVGQLRIVAKWSSSMGILT